MRVGGTALPTKPPPFSRAARGGRLKLLHCPWEFNEDVADAVRLRPPRCKEAARGDQGAAEGAHETAGRCTQHNASGRALGGKPTPPPRRSPRNSKHAKPNQEREREKMDTKRRKLRQPDQVASIQTGRFYRRKTFADRRKDGDLDIILATAALHNHCST